MIEAAAKRLGLSQQATLTALVHLGAACVERSPSGVSQWLGALPGGQEPDWTPRQEGDGIEAARAFLALCPEHLGCCLDDWQLANCPSIARRALRVGALTQQAAERLLGALDAIGACAAVRSVQTPNVPALADQRAKAFADLEHYQQVMRERAEDGLPVTETMQRRLQALRNKTGEPGEDL